MVNDYRLPITDYRLTFTEDEGFRLLWSQQPKANSQPTNEARVEAKFTLIIPSEEEEKPTQ